MTDSVEPSTHVSITRVAIIDDHPMILTGLGNLIGDQPDMEVCCQAQTPDEAWRQVESERPDLVILDLMLQKRNALHLLRRIKNHLPVTRVLILSLHPEDVYGPRAKQAGADGYINKEAGTTQVLQAMRLVIQGKPYFGEATFETVTDTEPETSPASTFPWSNAPLTNRELEVFELMGNGLSTKQIAQKLDISAKTVETYQSNLREKMSVHSGRELVRMALLWMNQQS